MRGRPSETLGVVDTFAAPDFPPTTTASNLPHSLTSG